MTGAVWLVIWGESGPLVGGVPDACYSLECAKVLIIARLCRSAPCS